MYHITFLLDRNKKHPFFFPLRRTCSQIFQSLSSLSLQFSIPYQRAIRYQHTVISLSLKINIHQTTTFLTTSRASSFATINSILVPIFSILRSVSQSQSFQFFFSLSPFRYVLEFLFSIPKKHSV